MQYFIIQLLVQYFQEAQTLVFVTKQMLIFPRLISITHTKTISINLTIKIHGRDFMEILILNISKQNNGKYGLCSSYEIMNFNAQLFY